MTNTLDTLPFFVEDVTATHASVSCMGDERSVALGEHAGVIAVGDFVFIEGDAILRKISREQAKEIMGMIEQGPYF